MSFAKAQDPPRLAQMAAFRRGGVNLEDICAEFDVSHRTAQRMTEALDAIFANVTTTDDAERRREPSCRDRPFFVARIESRHGRRLFAAPTPSSGETGLMELSRSWHQAAL